MDGPRRNFVEGVASTLSFLENQRYAVTELSEGFVVEKALLAWMKKKDDLCDRLGRALENWQGFHQRFEGLK
jgi:hypothetical protein